MVGSGMNFLDFLENIYGRAALEQIESLSGLDRKDIELASDAFAPAFLKGLMRARESSPSSGTGPEAQSPSFANFWPTEMTQAMQDFMTESARAAKQFSPSSSAETTAFPFNILAEQSGQMDKLYQVFLGQVAQAQLMDDVSKNTGISHNQLRTLFPMLTLYGLLPLMPQSIPPSMDDPAGWVDYLGAMGRQQFRQANRELDAMPSPVNAAFDGLLSGLFPKAGAAEPVAAEPDRAQQVRDAGLELQTTYIKGLNSLFESYASGVNKGNRED